jgi:hypothetical protein
VGQLYSLDDPYFKWVHQTEPACNGKNFGHLWFHCRQVSLYYGDEIKKGKVIGTGDKCMQNLGGEPRRDETTLKAYAYGRMILKWILKRRIRLAEDWDHWPTSLKTVMILPLHRKWIICWLADLPKKDSVAWFQASWTAWPFRMRSIGCPETSVRNYHYKLRKIPKERRFQRVSCLEWIN